MAGSLGTGPLHRCSTCQGVWVEEKTLRAHMGRSTGIPIRRSVGRTFRLPCVACRQPMEPLVLFDEPIDGACGIQISTFPVDPEGVAPTAATVDCALDAIDSLTVSPPAFPTNRSAAAMKMSI